MCSVGVGHVLVQAKVEQAQAMRMMSYFVDEVFQRLKHSLRFVVIQGRRLGQVDFHVHSQLLAPRQILVQLRLFETRSDSGPQSRERQHCSSYLLTRVRERRNSRRVLDHWFLIFGGSLKLDGNDTKNLIRQ